MMSVKLLWRILILSASFNILVASSSVSSQDNKKFSKCVTKQHFIHKNIAGRIKVLICTGTVNGIAQWQYTDGSSTLGEIFNPARDCPDIVDNLPGAKNGFYWISVASKTTHKVWCDLHTDGGGFMLVGMKDNPKTWTVPSNPTPVHPQGPPHWSSALGNVTVLDFRVQILTEKSFEGTKANWFYRLNQQRELGDLFTNKNGCSFLQPGIGNIKFVKDLMTKSVLSNKFKCSKFGQHVHSLLGWGKMNYCLRHACKNGYAVFSDSLPIIFDKFGSYSYNAVSSFSGMNHNSTAFVGCDHGKCCACFGPKGGRRNYCGPKCTAINGGTVTKKAFAWFWVRTRLPERVWKKCAEFLVKNSTGKLEKHFIDPKTGTPRKGSCSEQFQTLLNEGTLTTSDKESFQRIPKVPGVLSYRKDNQQLYVNEGSQWKALGTQEEEKRLKTELKSEIETLKKQSMDQERSTSSILGQLKSQTLEIAKLKKENKAIMDNLNILRQKFSDCTAIKKKYPAVTSGMYYLIHDGTLFPIYCDMTAENGVGVTVIGHDSEARTEVDGYEDPQSYRRKIKYEIAMKQIVAIINQSQKCKQFTRYECLNAGQAFGAAYSCWISRQGQIMRNWGGAPSNSEKCACGVTSSCRDSIRWCNCGPNDNVWSEDSGFLDDKSVLPVTELRFGDTGITADGNDEKSYYTLGKLLCWG